MLQAHLVIRGTIKIIKKGGGTMMNIHTYELVWVCLKIGYIPNEIAIFHRDNDHENHWVQWGTHSFRLL